MYKYDYYKHLLLYFKYFYSVIFLYKTFFMRNSLMAVVPPYEALFGIAFVGYNIITPTFINYFILV